MKKEKLYERHFKRGLDIIVSILAILILSPVFLILILLGYIQLKGNPFFIQDRPGKNDKTFKMIKFRTMSNAKDSKNNFLPADDRLIPYGKFLRKTSLDELPELINILKGDMSIVGPRPLLVKYLPLYNEHQIRRHEVRPGLTGHAQVNGRNNLDWQERLDLDVWYVDNISFKNDVKIIVKTVISILKSEGITSEKGGESFMIEFKGNED